MVPTWLIRASALYISLEILVGAVYRNMSNVLEVADKSICRKAKKATKGAGGVPVLTKTVPKTLQGF